MKPKILLFDIETMANLAYVWGKYEQDVISFAKPWYIICFAYKWLGNGPVKAYSLPDFKLYKREPENDRELVKRLWELFDEADVVIAHNGNAFDIKKAQAKFLEHGLRPPTPFKRIDTKLEARKYFKFDSNKLDDLGQMLDLGRKLPHTGFNLWLGCLKGDKKSWASMIRYNKQDVVLLEKVYLKLRPWMTHPNLNLLNNTLHNCPNCGSKNVQRRGVTTTRAAKHQRFQCTDCGAWSQGEGIKLGGKVIR